MEPDFVSNYFSDYNLISVEITETFFTAILNLFMLLVTFKSNFSSCSLPFIGDKFY